MDGFVCFCFSQDDLSICRESLCPKKTASSRLPDNRLGIEKVIKLKVLARLPGVPPIPFVFAYKFNGKSSLLYVRYLR